jgi:hypothetical protein
MYNTPVEPKHGARGIKFSFSWSRLRSNAYIISL